MQGLQAPHGGQQYSTEGATGAGTAIGAPIATGAPRLAGTMVVPQGPPRRHHFLHLLQPTEGAAIATIANKISTFFSDIFLMTVSPMSCRCILKYQQTPTARFDESPTATIASTGPSRRTPIKPFGEVLWAVREGGIRNGELQMVGNCWQLARQLYTMVCDVQMQRVNFFYNIDPAHGLKKWYIFAPALFSSTRFALNSSRLFDGMDCSIAGGHRTTDVEGRRKQPARIKRGCLLPAAT
jgi:hypothetical protein